MCSNYLRKSIAIEIDLNCLSFSYTGVREGLIRLGKCKAVSAGPALLLMVIEMTHVAHATRSNCERSAKMASRAEER